MKIVPDRYIGITMGDPAGIGPEVCLKLLTGLNQQQGIYPLIIGNEYILKRCADICGIESKIRKVEKPSECEPEAVNVIEPDSVPLKEFSPGRVSRECGQASYDYIIKGIDMALSRELNAIVTAPINKEALKAAGIDYPGHTEILAHRTGTKDFSMVFNLDHLYVAHVTTHISLRDAIDTINHNNVLNTLKLLDTTLKNMGYTNPCIAVSGLNPHAGEHGLFGTEEIEEITPAIEEAKSLGINTSGPYPPDTVFMRGFKGDFRGIVSMLHDHGFVALKSRDFERGVNITVGLPIIRTSVGHGTAFDIAWKDMASAVSIRQAYSAAVTLIGNKINH